MKRPRSTKFFGPDDLLAAAREAAAIDWYPMAIGGGLAMALHGSPRLTADVDVFVVDMPGSFGALRPGRALAIGGKSTRATNGVVVDFIRREGQYECLHDEAVAQAHVFEGSPLPLLTPPYLAALKMQAGRTKDEGDLEWLLAGPLRGDARYGVARDVVRRHLGPYAADELDRTHELAAWIASRAKK